MPTKRRRLTVTETPDIEHRLDRAAAYFPELAGCRKDLLLRLTELGERSLEAQAGASDPKQVAKRRILRRTTSISPSDAEAMLAARDAEWRHELDK